MSAAKQGCRSSPPLLLATASGSAKKERREDAPLQASAEADRREASARFAEAHCRLQPRYLPKIFPIFEAKSEAMLPASPAAAAP